MPTPRPTSLLGDQAASEDIASEALTRAYTRWSRISDYAPAWVVRVSYNLTMDWLRKAKKRHASPVEDVNAAPDPLSDARYDL